jgi:hypothetical protein
MPFINYPLNELTDMLLIYGEVRQNCNRAVSLYRERFPRRRIPDKCIFSHIVRRLRETGCLKPLKVNSGRTRYRRTVPVEEAILNRVENNPSTSTRIIAHEVGNISASSVLRTLQEQQLKPYHFTRVQELLPRDFGPRQEFCHWFLERLRNDRSFARHILFTDEACFTRKGILNFHNLHTWAEENPHSLRVANSQYEFSVNIWAGIIDNNIIGPIVLPNRLNHIDYLQFIKYDLPELLPVLLRPIMWFQHDGAPPHFAVDVRDYLNEAYGDRWIGRGGPVAWPPRSPDLNPLDFYLWGHVKEIVYKEPVNTREELLQRIRRAFENIRAIRHICRRVRSSLRRRLNACVDADGGHFQHFL